jgi:hypothetical protein
MRCKRRCYALMHNTQPSHALRAHAAIRHIALRLVILVRRRQGFQSSFYPVGTLLPKKFFFLKSQAYRVETRLKVLLSADKEDKAELHCGDLSHCGQGRLVRCVAGRGNSGNNATHSPHIGA